MLYEKFVDEFDIVIKPTGLEDIGELEDVISSIPEEYREVERVKCKYLDIDCPAFHPTDCRDCPWHPAMEEEVKACAERRKTQSCIDCSLVTVDGFCPIHGWFVWL